MNKGNAMKIKVKTKALKSLLVTSVLTAISMSTVVAMENKNMAKQNIAEQHILPPPGPYLSVPDATQLKAMQQNRQSRPWPMRGHPSSNQPPRVSNMPAGRGYPPQYAQPPQRRYMPSPRPEWAQRPPQMQNWTPPPRPKWAQRPPQAPNWNPPVRPQWDNQAPTEPAKNDQSAPQNSAVDNQRAPQYRGAPQRPDWAMQPPPRPEWAQRPPQMQNWTPPPRPKWAQRPPQAPNWNPPVRPQWDNQAPAEAIKNDQTAKQNSDVDSNRAPQYRRAPQRPDWAMQPPVQRQWRNPPPRPEWAQRPPQMQNRNPPVPPQWQQNQAQPVPPSAAQTQPQTGNANRYAAPDARGPVYGPGFPPPAYGYPPVR